MKRMTRMKLLVTILPILLNHCDAHTESCAGRCGRLFNVTSPCQCNDQCIFFDNCCKDYVSACNNTLACATRCRILLPDKSACERCSFFSNGCVSDDEIEELSATLWALDSRKPSAGDFEIDENGSRLFQRVSEEVQQVDSRIKISNFFEMYENNWELKEPSRPWNRRAEIKLINNFLKTDVGKNLHKFLRKKNLAGCGYKWEFKNLLKKLWAIKFKRNESNEKGSCGLENVFAGEFKDGVGIGLNNWLRVYQLERKGEIKIQVANDIKSQPGLARLKYNWNGNVGITTLFIGASPEWEFAVYTLCHIVRPDRSCTISAVDWNGKPYTVTLRSEYLYPLVPFNGLCSISNIQVFQ